ARTDAMISESFAEGIRRANMNAEAGADMVMLFPNTIEEACRAPVEVRAPLIFVNSEGIRFERRIFSITDLQIMGYTMANGAFSLGYAVFHLPGGWLSDRFGSRRVLTGAILCFSIFTAVTAIAPSQPVLGLLGAAWSFAIVRFVRGLGEAAAIPVGNKMMAYWLGEKERAFGTSIFLAGVGAGGVAAPLLVSWMIRQWGWRACFLLLGVAGTVLAALIYKYVTNRPEEHPGINA